MRYKSTGVNRGVEEIVESKPNDEMGLVQRLQSVKEVLRECMVYDATIRNILWGEGEAESDKLAAVSSNVGTISYDLLNMVCELRSNMDRVARNLDSSTSHAMKKVKNG